MQLTVRDAARMLNVSEDIVYRWIREKTIPVHRVNEHYRFHRDELLEWATARGVRVSAEEFHHPLGEGAAQPRFSEALAAGGIHHDVPGDDRDAALREVVARMPIDDADRDLVYDFLIAREAMGSTGVGEGIAIPHVRNPVVLHVPHPTIALCFLRRPIEFGAIDHHPVEILFTLVTPTVRSHLYLLSRLSAALFDERFKAALVRRAPREEILTEARRVDDPPKEGVPSGRDLAEDGHKKP